MQFRQPKVHQFITLSLCLVFMAWADARNVPPVKKLDFNRFFGRWYEIARLPNNHEKGLVEVTATIKKSDGKIVIVNEGFKGSRRGKRTAIKGEINIPNPKLPAWFKMKVWLFSLDYKIIEIDKNYQYALVAGNSDKFLWILSRTPVMDEDAYCNLVAMADRMGFNVSKLEKVSQDYNIAMTEKLNSGGRKRNL
ncbi:MAG: lipocalin family protein [Chitinispirillaceae bacterium]|nr:lipocalin family protein [Chitinispirillaceae bacterium]